LLFLEAPQNMSFQKRLTLTCTKFTGYRGRRRSVKLLVSYAQWYVDIQRGQMKKSLFIAN